MRMVLWLALPALCFPPPAMPSLPGNCTTASVGHGRSEDRAASRSRATPVPWHHPLYLGNGGMWRQRASVAVRNGGAQAMLGTTVSIKVGAEPGSLDIAGASVAALRVCDERGVEMLYAAADREGAPIRSGVLKTGMSLTIPVECRPGAEARYFVYFDNPSAWAPPDHLEGTAELRNGGVELGKGDTPTGWVHDAADAMHVASWASDESHSGRRSLKLSVARGAEHTWISTRQSGTHLSAGGRYRMTAWVKAEGVIGYAGWYIHIGNAMNTMMEAPMLSAGDGTFGWKSVSLEFTVPQGADRADLGTVLRGTGTAWFDDVSLERLDGGEPYSIRTFAPERLSLSYAGASDPWPDKINGDHPTYRTPIRVVNLGDSPRKGLVSVEASHVLGRLQGRMSSPSVAVRRGSSTLSSYQIGGSLLFEVSVPARSSLTTYAYPTHGPSRQREAASARPPVEYAPNPAVPGGMNRASAHVAPAAYAALMSGPHNLARNPAFEQGGDLPANWIGGAEGERPANTEMGVVGGGLFGKRCVRVYVPHTSRPAWTGWRQDVPVKPGRSYLFAAWLRSDDLRGGAQLHAHLRTKTGDLVQHNAMVSAGPAISGTTGWTLLSGTFRTPDDCSVFQMHLTMLATGTIWHDGVLLAEVGEAETLAMQTRARSADGVAMWPVNPIVKVFREDLPPSARVKPWEAVCAGNEYEPVQLAVRSSRDIRDARITVDLPRSTTGAILRNVQVGVVGYVPVDAPTNYYSSTTPSYYRRVPTGPAGSDGWAGWWPDPIHPTDRLHLRANVTQPIWVTFHVPAGARPGVYKGSVRIVSRSKPLAAVPVHVRVLGFDLPKHTRFRAIYDCRQSGPMWQVEGMTEQEAREAFWRFMAERRLCPDTVKPEPTFSFANGVATADFTQFDRAATVYFDELKFPHAYTPWHFYLFGWGHLPGDKFGFQPYEGAYPYEGVDRTKLRPEYRRAYQACLRLFWEHVKSKGWADRVVLYISDEPHDHMPGIVAQMKALCDMIHEVDRAIPIYCSTWHHQPEWDGKLDIWGIGHYGIVPVEKMRAIREGGARMWWTTDGQMCTDTPYCAIERLLPHYAFKYGAEGYEFWGVDWLTYDPYQYGWHGFLPHDFGPGQARQYVRYPNGDGFLAYPPGPVKLRHAVTSIRLEQAREGVEDWEYLSILRSLVDEGRRKGTSVAAGESALREAAELVSSPCEIGRYSTRILPEPDRVLRVKAAVGDAIARMSRELRKAPLEPPGGRAR